VGHTGPRPDRRVIVAAVFIGIGALDALLGLVAFPLAVSSFVLMRGRTARPLRLTGPEVHCLNSAMIAAAFILVPVAALLFYGASLLVSAAQGYGGCELFAVSNWLWRRDDQIACPVFHYLDLAERRAGHQPRERLRGV
jgi:hypothetical protein